MNVDRTYIFSLKGNQGTLCEDVTAYLSDNELKILDNISSCKDYDKGHGRVETRQCWVTYDVVLAVRGSNSCLLLVRTLMPTNTI